jgi:hypothetical protein
LVSVTNTGTGNNVLATSPTITTPTISSLSSAAATALTLQSAGTTAITVDTSQNVLVGTTSLYGGEKLAMLQSTNNRGFVIQQTNASNTNTPLVIDISRNTTNNTFNAIGYYNSGAGAYKFQVADSGSIATAGSVALGSSTPPTSGIGIAFPATQSASSDANTLDDYEEGTWTPTFSGSVNITGTPTFSYGRYTKVGRLVTISCQINATITTANLLTYPVFTLPITAIANPAVAGSCGCSSNLNSVGYVEITTSNVYLFFPAASLIPSGAQILVMSITYVAA